MTEMWSDGLPLRTYLRRQVALDRRLRRLLRAAAADARDSLSRLSDPSLRRAQLSLAQRQLELWLRMGVEIEDVMRASADDVFDVQRIFTDSLLRRAGLSPNSYWRSSMLASARETMNTYLAKQHNGFTLSERVYRNGQVASGKIDDLVSQGILQGKGARGIAADVYKYVSPTTPGGVSYAAMRLGRTELANAFHTTQTEQNADNPFVRLVEWRLSQSHPRADDCDNLVARYTPRNVPGKPHPQCMCHIVPVTMSNAELARRFKSGEFDAYADRIIAAA